MIHAIRHQLKSLVTHALGAKLLALFLAVVSWHGIRKTISFEVTTPGVRVEAVAPPGFAIQHQSDSSVDVTFRGSQEDIRNLDGKRLAVNVDLRDVRESGSFDVMLTPAMLEGSRGVRPIRIHPPRMTIELDREDEKRVPVRARIVGRQLSGQVDSVISEPAAVTLHGPARKLQSVDLVTTAPVDVDGRSESFARRIAVAQPSDTWVARIVPPEIEVEVKLTATPASREWLQQPVLAMVIPRGRRQIQVEPARVDVIVTGREDVLERLTDPLVFIDCTELKPNADYELPVIIRVRDLDVVVRAEPASVRVVVQDY